MLSRLENSVLKAIIVSCGDKHSCIIAAGKLLHYMPYKINGDLTKLNHVLKCLEYDGYFEVIYSVRRGEMVYCITLKQRGRAYLREKALIKRDVITRVILAVASAIITFLVGRFLYIFIN